MSEAVPVNHLPVELQPDPTRSVIRPFLTGNLARHDTRVRLRGERIVARVLSLGNEEVHRDLARARETFGTRHHDLEGQLLRRFDEVAEFAPAGAGVRHEQRLLIGAYFGAEFAYESAALFNPSIVAHPDQSGAPPGALRFIVSLRGVGEGHLSSIAFRIGSWHADGSVVIDPPSPVVMPPLLIKPDGWRDGDALALDCTASHDISETVLYPVIESQSRGIEDLRLTRLARLDGSLVYAGAYTAFGERGVRQELLETADFHHFVMRPALGDLEGKGMALFPRQIGERYLAVGRQDGENIALLTSDDLLNWRGGPCVLTPAYAWEFVQLGNCGSPIEIDEGWLLLTHGVGVARNYSLGAAVLDRDDPGKVLGRLDQPLIAPSAPGRDGYVPNVVYSCGGLVRDRTLLLPYAVADTYTRFATIALDDLVAGMR